MMKIKDEDRIPTAAREKQLVVYKGTAISPSADFQQNLYKPEWSKYFQSNERKETYSLEYLIQQGSHISKAIIYI